LTRPRWSLADARPQIVMLPKPKKKKPLAAGESDQGPCVRAIWGTEGLPAYTQTWGFERRAQRGGIAKFKISQGSSIGA
jgi:hypothetical protein